MMIASHIAAMMMAHVGIEYELLSGTASVAIIICYIPHRAADHERSLSSVPA